MDCLAHHGLQRTSTTDKSSWNRTVCNRISAHPPLVGKVQTHARERPATSLGTACMPRRRKGALGRACWRYRRQSSLPRRCSSRCAAAPLVMVPSSPSSSWSALRSPQTMRPRSRCWTSSSSASRTQEDRLTLAVLRAAGPVAHTDASTRDSCRLGIASARAAPQSRLRPLLRAKRMGGTKTDRERLREHIVVTEEEGEERDRGGNMCAERAGNGSHNNREPLPSGCFGRPTPRTSFPSWPRPTPLRPCSQPHIFSGNPPRPGAVLPPSSWSVRRALWP